MSINDGLNLAAALLLIAALAGVVRFAFATPEQRRVVVRRTGRALAVGLRFCGRSLLNLLLLAYVLASWRRVTRNLELAKRDKLRTVTVRRYENGESVERERPAIAYPWVFPRLDAYGLVLTVWTRVGVGRGQWEDAAEHLANTWRCRRVQIEQRKPGRITVRALRRDPLDARLTLTVPTVQMSERRTVHDQDSSAPYAA